ncbi:SDR family oxidoreductase [Luteibacter aegosomatissinici]|uniref:SDR family oxidoreductase n=1 Tax=Luteibacter aegosomatissinici TaxID=2911539 RepID=UPI001FFC1ED9|nr:NAD(P)H-binding protein [Luteibacter aegosomatissinici]UPG95162.1 NAD(P)H-binding protein [Luteibacter aegosomatissinici]
MNIVVIGGHGLVGRQVAALLRNDGHNVTAASRVTGVDIVTGAGLDDVLAGAHVVVDASNAEPPYGEPSYAFFTTGARHLLDAEQRAGVKHHVSISVVGTDRLESSPYFRGKAHAEAMIRASGVPYTILHATHFYEFLLAIVEAAIADQVLRLSPALIQPVASSDVAEAMAAIAVGEPFNATLELAGPERERMSDLVRRFVGDMESPFDVVTDPGAPYFGALLDDGSLVPRAEARCCTMPFNTWLRRSEYARANW